MLNTAGSALCADNLTVATANGPEGLHVLLDQCLTLAEKNGDLALHIGETLYGPTNGPRGEEINPEVNCVTKHLIRIRETLESTLVIMQRISERL